MQALPTYVVASQRPWNADLARRLSARTGARFVAISDAGLLTANELARLQPHYVFVAHWSTRIPQEVWFGFECVVFHMADVPYGRGGSPLQNLIARGHDATVLCALRAVEELDAGPVYLRRSLSLQGSAEEIFLRADRVIEQMIVDIIESQPTPIPQQGEAVVFRRRKPEDGDLRSVESLDGWYDLIRMLDADGYPRAYLDVGNLRLEFSRATRRVGGLMADVTIRDRSEENIP